MDVQEYAPDDASVVSHATSTQLQHFTETDPHCRALQLPDGIMLRYTLSHSLYFYLRTGVNNGNITTTVFASDTPYDRTKADIGVVITPMFEPDADGNHLVKLKKLLYSWVGFTSADEDADEGFKSFSLKDNR